MGRRLGQHFLTDPTILDRIVDALDPQPADVVIEIGPGKGSLTRRLVGRVGQVVAVEQDAELVRELEGQGAKGKAQGSGTSLAGVTIVMGDALRVDWASLIQEHAPRHAPSTLRGRHKVIGNIPYSITSPLIDKALTAPLPERIVFLVQKEVAERLAAPPGGRTYGALTVGVQAVADVERLFAVKRGAFSPPPAVDSAVVRITPKPEPLISPDEQSAFRTFVQALFSRRRKQMVGIVRAVASLPKDRAEEVLARVLIDPKSRPETLAPETIVRLFRALRAAG